MIWVIVKVCVELASTHSCSARTLICSYCCVMARKKGTLKKAKLKQELCHLIVSSKLWRYRSVTHYPLTFAVCVSTDCSDLNNLHAELRLKHALFSFSFLSWQRQSFSSQVNALAAASTSSFCLIGPFAMRSHLCRKLGLPLIMPFVQAAGRLPANPPPPTDALPSGLWVALRGLGFDRVPGIRGVQAFALRDVGQSCRDLFIFPESFCPRFYAKRQTRGFACSLSRQLALFSQKLTSYWTKGDNAWQIWLHEAT